MRGDFRAKALRWEHAIQGLVGHDEDFVLSLEWDGPTEGL